MSKTFSYILNLKGNMTNKLNSISNVSQRVFANVTKKNQTWYNQNNKLGNSIDGIKQKLKTLEQKRNVSISKKEIRLANVETRKLQKELHKLENLPPNGFIGGLRNVKGLLGQIGGAAIGAGIGFAVFEGVKGIGKLGMDMEQTEVAFETMLGSMDKAKGMITGLDKFANATPFENDVLYKNSKLLLNFGMTGKKVIPTLRMLGDVSGGNKQKLDSLSLAYAQVQSAGKLTGQDLLQMINAGFNPLNEISKKTGKSMGELKKAMSKGAISADMVEGAFKGATSEGGRFYKMMEKQSKTAAGKMSTLMGKLKQKGIALGKKLLPVINKMIDAGLWLIDNISRLVTWYKKYADIINFFVGGILIAITAYKSYVLIVAAVKAVTVSWAIAQKALNFVMSLNPIGLIIAGIALLVAAITYVIMKTDGWAKQWQNFKGMFVAYTQMMTSNFKIAWLETTNAFANATDTIVLTWKKAQNAMGLISDNELAKEKTRIQIQKDKRIQAIVDTQGKYDKAANDLKKSAKWELKWNSSKNSSFAKAKAKASNALGLGNSTDGLLDTTDTTNTPENKISNDITSGGKKQTNITINLGKFQDSINIYSQNMSEGIDELQEKIEVAMLKVLNSGNSLA